MDSRCCDLSQLGVASPLFVPSHVHSTLLLLRIISYHPFFHAIITSHLCSSSWVLPKIQRSNVIAYYSHSDTHRYCKLSVHTKSKPKMHRALRDPAIVANIIAVECLETSGFLYTCLFINRLFFTESSRILWWGPGSSSPILGMGFRAKDLAAVVRQDLGRAQIYANLVKSLGLGYETVSQSEKAQEESTLGGEELNEEDDDEFEEGSTVYVHELRWHDELSKLNYPKLTSLGVSGIGSDEESSIEDPSIEDLIPKYFYPTLEELSVSHARLTDEYFVKLRQCTMIRELHFSEMGGDPNSTLFTEFITASPHLTSIRIADMPGIWSQWGFAQIARKQNLKTLEIATIEDSWLKDLTDMINGVSRNGEE